MHKAYLETGQDSSRPNKRKKELNKFLNFEQFLCIGSWNRCRHLFIFFFIHLRSKNSGGSFGAYKISVLFLKIRSVSEIPF